jgi:Cu-Zn family superoxide dismutase
LTGTVLEYVAGFNVNGIVVTPDNRYLIAVQSNTGELFRITIASGEVAQIDLRGATVTAGDGLVLNGRVLYVVRNSFEEVVTIALTADRLQGFVSGTFTDESFAFPTTAAWTGNRLLVVNSQFDQREGQPVLPFTVSSVVPTVGGR